MGILRYKAGVQLKPDPAGGRLHGAIERVARTWPTDLTITAGSDSHGPTDPHTLGRAFDVRTHGMTDDEKQKLANAVLDDLEPSRVLRTLEGIWYAASTPRWFAQVENHNTETEHVHCQLRNAAVFG